MIPKFIKQNPLYPRARVAALSMISSPRFYTPRSAALFCPGEPETAANSTAAGEAVRLIRRDATLALWNTCLGETATSETEALEHIAFLTAEFQRDVYLSGPVGVKPGAIVLDVGANIGLFTRQALGKGAERVVAFEPSPGNRRALQYNVAEGLTAGRVSIIEAGAWNVRDKLLFALDPEKPGRSSCMESEAGQNCQRLTIEAVPIDEVVRSLMLPRVDFVKMDIEGAELKALEGAADMLRKYKPQLAVAVEHTDNWLLNARNVRDLVLATNPAYKCSAGPYMVTKKLRLAPEILYFL